MSEGVNSGCNHNACSFYLLAILQRKVESLSGLRELRNLAAIDVRHSMLLIPEPVLAKIFDPDPLGKGLSR